MIKMCKKTKETIRQEFEASQKILNNLMAEFGAYVYSNSQDLASPVIAKEMTRKMEQIAYFRGRHDILEWTLAKIEAEEKSETSGLVVD